MDWRCGAPAGGSTGRGRRRSGRRNYLEIALSLAAPVAEALTASCPQLGGT